MSKQLVYYISTVRSNIKKKYDYFRLAIKNHRYFYISVEILIGGVLLFGILGITDYIEIFYIKPYLMEQLDSLLGSIYPELNLEEKEKLLEYYYDNKMFIFFCILCITFFASFVLYCVYIHGIGIEKE